MALLKSGLETLFHFIYYKKHVQIEGNKIFLRLEQEHNLGFLFYQVSIKRYLKLILQFLYGIFCFMLSRIQKDPINEDGLMPMHYYNGVLCSTLSLYVID